MKSALTLLLIVTAVTTSALAQTKTPTKSATKQPVIVKPTTAKTTTKVPTAKPANTKATPARTSSTSSATKPASKPATTTAPATPAPTPAATPKLEIPGVAAQKAPSFAKGTVAVSLGIGLGIGYGYSTAFGGSLKSSPALSLSAEKGIVEGIGPGIISVGGLLGYKSYSYEWADYKSSWKNIYVSARGAYHYNFTDNPKIDTYAGVSLAARIEKYSTNYSGVAYNDSYGNTSLEAGIFLGGRYLLTEKIGAFAELGYDMSYLKLGATAKF
jgi:hypothetical protein